MLGTYLFLVHRLKGFYGILMVLEVHETNSAGLILLVLLECAGVDLAERLEEFLQLLVGEIRRKSFHEKVGVVNLFWIALILILVKLNSEVLTFELGTVHFIDGFLSIIRVLVLNECETT